MRVLRLDPHTSSDDDNTYRSAAEKAEMHAADPLPRFRRSLLERSVLRPAEADALDARVAAAVDAATEAAERSPLPTPSDLPRHVYAEEVPMWRS